MFTFLISPFSYFNTILASFYLAICENLVFAWKSLRFHLITPLLLHLHLSSVIEDGSCSGPLAFHPAAHQPSYTPSFSLAAPSSFASSTLSLLSSGPCLSVYLCLPLRPSVLVPDGLKPPMTSSPQLKQ